MIVTGFHYNVSDMDGYAESGWSRQQVEPVEPVDLSCPGGGMSRPSGYGEPLDLSTSRRPHASGYDVGQYYAHAHAHAHAQPHYYEAAVDESPCRRWVAPPDGYPGYGAQTPYGGATCHEWTNWSGYDVGIGDAKPYPDRFGTPMRGDDPDKTSPSFAPDPYPEQSPTCAFAGHHRKRDACRFPDLTHPGYAPAPPAPLPAAAERSAVYRTNGGSCKYARGDAYRSPRAAGTEATTCPEPANQYGRCPPEGRKPTDRTGSGRPRPAEVVGKESEPIPVFLSNCKHFAGGLVVSRPENNGSPLTEALPPISIPDFEFKCEEPATEGEKAAGDDLKPVAKCPGGRESGDETNTSTKGSGSDDDHDRK